MGRPQPGSVQHSGASVAVRLRHRRQVKALGSPEGWSTTPLGNDVESPHALQGSRVFL